MHTAMSDPTWGIAREILLGDRSNAGILGDWREESSSRDRDATACARLAVAPFSKERDRNQCPVSPDEAASLVRRLAPQIDSVLAALGLSNAAELTVIAGDRRAAIRMPLTPGGTPVEIPLTLVGGSDVSVNALGNMVAELTLLRDTTVPGPRGDETFQSLIVALPNETAPADVRGLRDQIRAVPVTYAVGPVAVHAIEALRNEGNAWELISTFMPIAHDLRGTYLGLPQRLLRPICETLKGRLTTDDIVTVVASVRRADAEALDAHVNDARFCDLLSQAFTAMGTQARADHLVPLTERCIDFIRHVDICTPRWNLVQNHMLFTYFTSSLSALRGSNVPFETVEAVFLAAWTLVSDRKHDGWCGLAGLESALHARPENRTSHAIDQVTRAILDFESATRALQDATSRSGDKKAMFLHGALLLLGENAAPGSISGLIPVYRRIIDCSATAGTSLMPGIASGIFPWKPRPGTDVTLSALSRCVDLACDCASRSPGGRELVTKGAFRQILRALDHKLPPSSVAPIRTAVVRTVDEMENLSRPQRRVFIGLAVHALESLPACRASVEQVCAVLDGATELSSEGRRGRYHPNASLAATQTLMARGLDLAENREGAPRTGFMVDEEIAIWLRNPEAFETVNSAAALIAARAYNNLE